MTSRSIGLEIQTIRVFKRNPAVYQSWRSIFCSADCLSCRPPSLPFQPPPGAWTRAQLGNQMKWEFLTSCNLSSNRVTECNLKTCFEVCIWVLQCVQKVDVFQKCSLESTYLHSELFSLFTHMRQEAYCVNL